MNQFYENANVCSKCGGKCCKGMPGCEFPEDLDLPDETKLREKLASGNYAIDWWDGDIDPVGDLSRVLYLRPATKNAKGIMFDASWGGECIFLTPQGCHLEAKDRPHGCRELEPHHNSIGNCIPHDGAKEGAAKAWRPYQEILKRIGREFQ